jgi:hypothetical protein
MRVKCFFSIDGGSGVFIAPLRDKKHHSPLY